MNAQIHQQDHADSSAWRRVAASAKVVAADIGHGLLLVSHNTLALLGLLVIALAIVGVSKPDVRQEVESWAFGWLQSRQPVVQGVENLAEPAVSPREEKMTVVADASAVTRATATDPNDLSREQANVAKWIAQRYKVAPEPIGRLVQEAWDLGERFKLEPTLILAIMAVESSFNPFAQSSVGAQGLMQVMTRIHDKKYEPFGGVHAAFDPVTNLLVGVQVLKECIARGGSLYDGLRHYVGAANLASDGGYADKVLAEHANLQKVAAGKALPTTTRMVPLPAPVKPAQKSTSVAAPQTNGASAEPKAEPVDASTDATNAMNVVSAR